MQGNKFDILQTDADIYCPGHMTGFLHLFELDQTFFTADGFAAVLPLQQETFVRAGGAADVAEKHGQVVDFVVVDETGVAAKSLRRSIQSPSELTLSDETAGAS